MKFCKQYTAYMRGLESSFSTGFSFVQLKRLKQVLKKCRRDFSSSAEADHQHSHPQLGQMGESQLCLSSEASSPQSFNDLELTSAKPAFLEVEATSINPEQSNCHMECAVCDGTFFPLLLKEVAAVAACFNARVRQLLRFRIASGFQKYLLRLKYKQQFLGNQLDMAQEGKYLVGYACMNSLAIRKILKKYDKVHYSRKGRAFKMRLQTLHVEILQSPWLIELIALHINLKESLCASPEILEDCSNDFGANNPVISCTLRNSLKMEVDLSCSICLTCKSSDFRPSGGSCCALCLYLKKVYFSVTLADIQIFGFSSKWWPVVVLHVYILRGHANLWIFVQVVANCCASCLYLKRVYFSVTLADIQIFGFSSKWWPAVVLHVYILRGEHANLRIFIQVMASYCASCLYLKREMVFDPVSLSCGHIFCKSCACCAASIPTVQGLKAAMRTSRCPLCRQPGVYSDAVFLNEVGLLISTRFNTYWRERLKRERVERLQQAKEHWDNQCRTFVGL